MVVECIPEIKNAKIELLDQPDKCCTDDTIIATISSSYKSRDLIGNVSEQGRARVLNTHYFQPPELPPVEVMSSGYTDPAIIDFLGPKLREIGLDPVVAKQESTDLIYNRVWAALKREIMMVLADEVGTPEDIDKLFRYSLPVQRCALRAYGQCRPPNSIQHWGSLYGGARQHSNLSSRVHPRRAI